MAENKGINPLATGVAGAIIGAAAAAAAMFLSDEKNRKKAEKVLGELEEDGSRVFKEVKRMALELKDKGLKALPEVSIKSKKRSVKKKA